MSSEAHQIIQSEEERSRAVKRVVVLAALAVIAAIASCTGVHFLYVFVSTADSADLADRYLTAVREDRISDAYQLTSAKFRDEQGPEAFADVMDVVSMAGHELVSWENRTLDHNGFNIYMGTLTTGAGRTLPLMLEVVEEDGVDDFGAVDAHGQVAFEVGGFAGAGDDGKVAALAEVVVEFAGVTHLGEPVFAGGEEFAEGDDDQVAEGRQAGGAGVGAAAADDEGAGAGEGGFDGGDAGADGADACALLGVVQVGRFDQLEADFLEDDGQPFDL